MTKGELIDKILLGATGGTFSDEANVMRPDIEVWLDAAIQEFIAVQSEQEEIMNWRQARTSGMPTTGTNSAFMSAREIEIKDGYGVLPPFYKLKGGGIESVRTSKGHFLTLLSSPKALDGLDDCLGDTITAYHEKIGAQDRLYANKDCSVIVRLAITIQGLETDEEVPLPPRFAATLIERSVAHFKGQRWPADYLDDEIDRPQQ